MKRARIVQHPSFAASAPLLTDENAPGFADLVGRLVEEARVADADLWVEVGRLAATGDCAQIAEVAELRKTMAPADILAALHSRRRPRLAR